MKSTTELRLYCNDRLVSRWLTPDDKIIQQGKRVRLKHLTREEQRIYVLQGAVAAVKAIIARLRAQDPNAGLRDAKDLLDAERMYQHKGRA
jgi:hypothetical protein